MKNHSTIFFKNSRGNAQLTDIERKITRGEPCSVDHDSREGSQSFGDFVASIIC